MSQKVLIFDFDGTIADTFQLTVKICQMLANEFHFKKIGSEDIEPLKGLSSQDVIKYLGVNPFFVPAILLRAREESHKNIHTIEPIQGLTKVLQALKALGNTIGILTSNSTENVHKFLQKHQMDFFDFVTTSSKIWGKHHSINRLIQVNGYEPKDIFYIGDETRDIEAAKKSKIQSIAVTWGYNSHQVLLTHKPDHVIDKPEELIGIL